MKKSKILLSFFLSGMVCLGSQRCFGANISQKLAWDHCGVDVALTVASAPLMNEQRALQIARNNASTLTTTGYQPLVTLSQDLKILEGESGPIAAKVFLELKPSIEQALDSCSMSKNYRGVENILRVVFLFVKPDDPLP